jgi:ribosomal protein S18 acetylase RimI-like enzyme
MRVELSDFSDDCAREIAGWPIDADEARLWAGDCAAVPFEPDQFRRWHADPDVHPFVGLCQGGLVAYGELWIDRIEREIELARIIVDPAQRGQGVGRSFVNALAKRAAGFKLRQLTLRVFSDNLRAIACYRAAGFVTVSQEEQNRWNQNQPTAYLWLRSGA